jgi:glutathione S-transferase
MAARVGELYVGAPLTGLFMQAMAESRDPAVVAAKLEELDKGLEYLNLVLSGDRYAAGATLTTGDVCLAPMLFYVPMMGAMFGRDVMAGHPKVAAYVASVSEDPHVARVLGEIQRGLAVWRKQRGA